MPGHEPAEVEAVLTVMALAVVVVVVVVEVEAVMVGAVVVATLGQLLL